MRRRVRPANYSEAWVPDFVTYIEIRQAIVRHDFFLEYHPKVSLPSGLIEGVEALVRWQHSSRGRMPPDMFLPEIERRALMERLTRLVLDDAVAQCSAFHRQGVLVGMAVNVSPSALTSELPGQVTQALDRHGVEAHWLTLEITQTAVVRDFSAATMILGTIRAAGVHVSLDDFGTGYSSLAHLQDLPIDEIKIDRSFVSRATASPRDVEIIRFATELGQRLKLRVVAEGVENEATLSLLHTLRVDAAQGYYFAPPLPAADLVAEFPSISAKARQKASLPSVDLVDRTTSDRSNLPSAGDQ